jgi:hypothetical protein
MSSWPQVREALSRLEDLEPRVLMSYPNLTEGPEPRPPFSIRLMATALPIAEELHSRFGDEVTLRVGALPFPPRPADAGEQRAIKEPLAPDHALDGIQVELDGPVEVKSGETARNALLITNETASELAVHTNGGLTADVVDLRDGRHVGGFFGPVDAPLVIFTVAPGSTTRVPLGIGTTSFVADIGYVIPPGPWGITVELDLGAGRRLRTPVLAFEVVA